MTAIGMRTDVVAATSSRLGALIALADLNSDTLGFIPEEAIRKAARSGQLIAAIGEGEELLGYVWFSVTRNPCQARIHHLCIDSRFRGLGAAKSLVDAVKDRTRHVYGIALRCRRDYPSHGFWPRVGFVALAERPGRGQDDTCLTCFWYDHGHPTLITQQHAQLASDKLVAVLDANVFFDLSDDQNPRNRQARSLRADWLTDSVALWITDELYNEILRHDDAAIRTRDRALAQQFPPLQVSGDALNEARGRLLKLLPAPHSESDWSDHAHLAAAIAAQADFFITRDRELTEHSPQLSAECGLEILTPLEFILGFDELRRKSDYQPVRLAGSQLTIKPVTATDANELYGAFRGHAASETRGEFDQRLRDSLVTPTSGRSIVVKAGDEPLALLLLSTAPDGTAELPMFRVKRNSLAPTLARHLLARMILIAVGRHSPLLRLTDPHTSDCAREACLDLGFVTTTGTMTKLLLRGLSSTLEVRQRLQTLGAEDRACAAATQEVATLLQQEGASTQPDSLARVERLLWPLRVFDAPIENFLIPIQPRWAKQLFDEGLAAQDLFGVDAFLALQHENAYYRSAHQQIVTAPGRVLWYVSKQAGYSGTAQVRACSSLDEVVVGPAKSVFKQLRRLGVYAWEEVLATARGDCNATVVGFRFSGTTLFEFPIPRTALLNTLTAERGVTPQLTTALHLRPTEFARLFSNGFGGQPRSECETSVAIVSENRVC